MRLIKDQRGVAAMEFGVIGLFMIALLLPIADLASAALQYVGAYQSLRDLGAYAQYHVPPDVTNTATWSLPTITGHVITTAVMCGSAAAVCSATNTASPKWFNFSTNITLAPMFLTSMAGTYTIYYSERFQ
jgi:Flp pilus assembly protein TadG